MKNNGRMGFIYLVFLLVIIFSASYFFSAGTSDTMKYSDVTQLFYDKQVSSFTVDSSNVLTMTLKDGKKVEYQLLSLSLFYEDLNDTIKQQKAEGVIDYYDYEAPAQLPVWMSFLPYIIVIVIMIVVWWLFISRASAKNSSSRDGSGGFGGLGGRMNSFSKARTKLGSDEKKKVLFSDVAGADEEKEELKEVVEFLKNPDKYSSLGARIPKGVLLVGAPGTGKTLLAKAVAGESGVPFYSISGSDFVEMFSSFSSLQILSCFYTGASRVRDLFETAKKTAPCIVFIDEIDAVGRHRGAGWGGGHDEREQTLNQLLVEMDGFGVNDGVICMAATNRPDILDPALLRPGRFDRQITVNYPDIKGRVEILKVHARNKPFEETVDLETIAKSTAGFTGADLANLLNEAALLAARKGKKLIGMDELEEANIKVIVGPQKRSQVINDEEKRATAYHEAGHAIVARFLPTQDPVHQISIIPSGRALGYTLTLPTEDKNNIYKNEMLETISRILGGRVAEKLVLKDISAGASNDIQRATEMARKMVMQYGMSDTLGPILFGTDHDEVFLGKDFTTARNYSEKIASEIDDEIHSIITSCYKKAEQILTDNMDKLHFIAEYLVGREIMDGDQFEAVFAEDASFEKLDEIKERKTQRSVRENEERRRKSEDNTSGASSSDDTSTDDAAGKEESDSDNTDNVQH